MKILFFTTYNITLIREHFFTKNVAISLYSESIKINHEIEIVTISSHQPNKNELVYKTPQGDKIENKIIDISKCKNSSEITKNIINYIEKNKPDIIHSQMIEGFDIEAAKFLNIPIVNTVHIGGFICPRGGGNGFLKYDNSICDQPIGKTCEKCMSKNMPLPFFTFLLNKAIPRNFKLKLRNKINKNLFYVTPFLNLSFIPEEKKRFINLAKYSHIICANKKLIELCKVNGLNSNLHLLPHGVKIRKRLPLPSLEEPIKFYFLGRIQFSKGLHIIIKALKEIPKNIYELHILGDADYMGKKEEKYFQKLKGCSKNLNIIWHGRVNNEKIEDYIKNFHVMIHPTICHEIYGIAIAESLSMGRPVLATRCGGAEMQIKDNFNGWLINPNDIQDMKKKILSIISNKEDIVKFSKNANLPYSIENYSKSLFELYSKIKKQ